MKLATFNHRGRARLGRIVDDRIHVTAWPESLLSAVQRGITPSMSNESFPLGEVKLEAPLIPGKILAIGLNYADHAAETGQTPPDHPLVFAKFPSSVIGSGDVITWRTATTNEVDYEAELAVIIGRRAKDVSEEDALSYVYGYTCANDVSARDLQQRIDKQWTRAKSLDTFCPLGPVVVTRDEIADPNALAIRAVLNGETVQNGTTANMIFDVRMLVSYLSQQFTLEPGDVILTGTPPGVGTARTPQLYLKDGDTITVSIDGIGDLTNTCRVLA